MMNSLASLPGQMRMWCNATLDIPTCTVAIESCEPAAPFSHYRIYITSHGKTILTLVQIPFLNFSQLCTNLPLIALIGTSSTVSSVKIPCPNEIHHPHLKSEGRRGGQK